MIFYKKINTYFHNDRPRNTKQRLALFVFNKSKQIFDLLCCAAGDSPEACPVIEGLN